MRQYGVKREVAQIMSGPIPGISPLMKR